MFTFGLMSIATAYLLLLSIKQIQFARLILHLKDISVPEIGYAWPKVSLIVPACNEGPCLEFALRGLLKMDYESLEIIVVNDRSTDGTAALLKRMGLEYPQLKIITVESLPELWLGKVHAQNMATHNIKGDWILYTDADVHYSKQALKKAITYCESRKIDFLTVIPDIQAKGSVLKAAITQFLVTGTLAIDISKIKNQKRAEAVGCGAFNLVRTSAYKKSRGLEWLRMEVIDDGGFGYMMKESGASCDVLSGKNEIEIEWYSSLKDFVVGLEKNAFSIFQYNIWYFTSFALIMIFAVGSVYWSLFHFSWNISSWVFISSLIFYYLSAAAVIGKLSNFSKMYVFTLPFGKLLALFVVARGMVLFLIRGGIRWRTTFYSRENLITMQKLRLIDFIFLKKFPK